MRRRQETGTDPTLKRWNASIRLSNFASVESSPLCVSFAHRQLKSVVNVLTICSDVLNWSATWSPCSAKSRWRVRRRRPGRPWNSRHRIYHAVSQFFHLPSIHVFADRIVLQWPGYANKCRCSFVCGYIGTVLFMLINKYSSLQIFETESHASVHSDKTKEGLSLFGKLRELSGVLFAPLNEVCDHQLGFLNNTTSSFGRSLLRTWLLRPSLSIPVITARHDAVACFLRPENLVTTAAMHSHLKGIKNVPRILGTIRCGKAGVGQWQGLVKVGDPWATLPLI